MDIKTTIDRFNVTTKGETLEIPLAPHDEVTIAINGVIGKTIQAPDYMKLQIKTWTTYRGQ